MSTKHSKAAEKFLQDSKMAAWHNETLWMVRAKRDKMSKEVPEWEECYRQRRHRALGKRCR